MTDNDDMRSDPDEIVTNSSYALSQRSDGLVRRGLHDLTTWDVARFVELGKALTSSLQLNQALKIMTEKMDELLHPDTWYLLLLDESKQALYFELAIGKNAHALNEVRINMGRGIAGWAAENGEAAVVPDVRRDARFLQEVDGWPEIEMRSIVAVPLRFQERCLGVIGLVNYVGPQGFSQTDLSLLQAFADFSAIALENARHMQSIHELTIIDALTGLYNYRHLNFILDTEVYRSQRHGYEFSLLLLDFDGSQELAKSLSYVHFTHLLTEVGHVLKDQLRLIDFGFQGQNGEIILVLPQTSKESGGVIAHRLQSFFTNASWLRAEGQDLKLPARIVAVAFPEDGKTKADLLRAMDEAMYRLKK